MITNDTHGLPDWQAQRLTLLLNALNGVVISDAERASLAWLAGQELPTVRNMAAVITRARSTQSL